MSPLHALPVAFLIFCAVSTLAVFAAEVGTYIVDRIASALVPDPVFGRLDGER